MAAESIGIFHRKGWTHAAEDPSPISGGGVLRSDIKFDSHGRPDIGAFHLPTGDEKYPAKVAAIEG